MDAVDRLDPLPPKVAGGVTFLVDRARPVAALRAADGSVAVVTWPDAPLPAQAASPSVLTAPGCVWVVYADDSMDGPGFSTAVRVGADAQVSACELGLLGAIGADDQGVWLSPDPYLAMEGAPTGGDYEEPEDDVEALEGPPAWVRDAPVEAWEDFGRVEREASDAHMEADVALFLDTASPKIEEGESFGWFAFPPGSEPPPPEAVPDPPPPTPTGPVTLHRVRADGEHEEMTVSRVVSRVDVTGDGVLSVVFHPTGPVYTADGDGGHFVDYPQRVTEIDVRVELPGAVDLDAVPSQPFENEDEEEEEPPTHDADRIDLTGIAGTRWSLRPLSTGEVETAVEAVRAQYATLAEPNTVWTARDNNWHRVQSEYADVQITTAGPWPWTEVVADFTYRPAPDRAFRRRTRVFDDAGAPAVSQYLTVYLDEDLATTDLDQLPVLDGRRQI